MQPRTASPERAHSTAAAGTGMYEWSRTLQAQLNAPQLARLHARTWLTMARWPGNQEAAVVVAGLLTANALIHATPRTDRTCIGLRLTTRQDHELLIDVSDPLPEFPDFTAAAAGERGRGLRQVARLGCDLTWFITASGDHKTVRARMAPGPVPQ